MIERLGHIAQTASCVTHMKDIGWYFLQPLLFSALMQKCLLAKLQFAGNELLHQAGAPMIPWHYFSFTSS